ncbi:MAG: transporter substrate-binding domain-containing protein [Thermodesulfobacteriota bacterium]
MGTGLSRAETILLAADAWPPFNAVPGDEHQGYMVDIAKEIFEKEGHTVKYVILPWKRALTEVEKGTVHGVIGASKGDGQGLVFPRQELARNVLSFYKKKGDSFRFTGEKSLPGVRLGVIKGYDYRKWLNSYIQKNHEDLSRIEVITGNDPLQRNLKKLLAGRLGAVVDNEAAIRSVAKSMGILSQIEVAGYGTEPSYCYIAFSPKKPSSQGYADILSRGIFNMRARGRLAEILSIYGLTDWRSE